MHKKFEINRKKIKGGCQSGRKVVTHNSKRDLPLVQPYNLAYVCIIHNINRKMKIDKSLCTFVRSYIYFFPSHGLTADSSIANNPKSCHMYDANDKTINSGTDTGTSSEMVDKRKELQTIDYATDEGYNNRSSNNSGKN